MLAGDVTFPTLLGKFCQPFPSGAYVGTEEGKGSRDTPYDQGSVRLGQVELALCLGGDYTSSGVEGDAFKEATCFKQSGYKPFGQWANDPPGILIPGSSRQTQNKQPRSQKQNKQRTKLI